MCGFLLAQNYRNKKKFDKALKTMKFRGPDFTAIQEKKSINSILGHNRLAIQDISTRSNQPFYHDDHSLVYNGEIYNYLELKEELHNKGVCFLTTSDTEVLLKSYLYWGKGCLNKFNGMWAFAILNMKNGDVFASRDRFGIKPLYYYNKDFFCLSSQVKGIHSLLGRNADHNIEVLKDLVKGQFKWHGTTCTYLKDVSSLLGGCNLIKKNGKVVVERWYKFKKKKNIKKSIDDQADDLKKIIIESCRLRLRSHVPVATCLSGGIDSGGILSIISKNIKKNDLENFSYKAFTVSFPKNKIDESDLARTVASDNQVSWEMVKLDSPDIDEIKTAMRKLDGPMNSLAFYPIYCLYKRIGEHGIKVTLDGQGPDEMLGGYDVFSEAIITAVGNFHFRWFFEIIYTFIYHGHESIVYNILSMIKRLCKILFEKKTFLTKKIIKKIFSINKKKLSLKNGIKEYPKTPLDEYMMYNLLEDKDFFYHEEDTFNKSLLKQFFHTILPGILFQYDGASMANGIECRMPYMDHRVVEFLLSLPSNNKISRGYTKFILRHSLKDTLNKKVRIQKKKIGFNAPITNWFKDSLREWMLEIMNSREFLENDIFDGKKIKKEFEKFILKKSPKFSEGWKFWGHVHYAWWLRELKKGSLV